MEVPTFNPNAPGVILLGQIILDYNNHPASQTGSQQGDSNGQSQSDETRTAPPSEHINGGQFAPSDFIPSSNCAPPKVYYTGPCSYGIPPPGVAQVLPQFVIPQGPPTNLRFGNYVPVPMYPQYNQTINLSNGVAPLQFAGNNVPHGPCTQGPHHQQAPVYSQQYSHSHSPCMPPNGTHSTARRPKTAPDIRGDFHGGSNICYPPVGIHTSTSGTDLLKTGNCCGDFVRAEQPSDSLADLEGTPCLDNFAAESKTQGLTMSYDGVDEPADESLSEATCCDNPKIFNPNAREFYPTSSAENLSICESDLVHKKLKDAQGSGDDNEVSQVNQLEQG